MIGALTTISYFKNSALLDDPDYEVEVIPPFSTTFNLVDSNSSRFQLDRFQLGRFPARSVPNSESVFPLQLLSKTSPNIVLADSSTDAI